MICTYYFTCTTITFLLPLVPYWLLHQSCGRYCNFLCGVWDRIIKKIFNWQQVLYWATTPLYFCILIVIIICWASYRLFSISDKQFSCVYKAHLCQFVLVKNGGICFLTCTFGVGILWTICIYVGFDETFFI